MSKKYIEREALLNQIGTVPLWTGYNRETYTFELHLALVEIEKGLKALIKETPAVDVAPVVHGRWYDEDSFRLSQQVGGLHYAPIYRCSVCNKTVADEFIENHKYCLHCGAKMDKGE